MRIACLFIPHFAVAVEQRAQSPELRAKPMVIGGTPEERKVVLDCCSQAVQSGVRVGMPLREALSRCREAVFREANHALYEDTAKAMVQVLDAVSPLVEPAELGQVFVGLSGLDAGPRAERQLAQTMARAVHQATQLTPRIGVADGKFAALAAAVVGAQSKPRVVPAGEGPKFLAGLPVACLPVTPDMQRRLGLFGLRTLGQLAALPLSAMQAQFGSAGRVAWELANGIDESPLIPHSHPTTLAERMALPAPVATSEPLLVAARLLILKLVNRPEFARHAARGLSFKAALADGHVWERHLVFREPLLSAERIFLALRTKLRDAALPAVVEEIELELLDICGESGRQDHLFPSQRGQQLSQVDEVVRQLTARYGKTPVAKIVEVEPWSRLPERRFALIDYSP